MPHRNAGAAHASPSPPHPPHPTPHAMPLAPRPIPSFNTSHASRPSPAPQVPCAVLLRGSGPHAVDYGAAGGREVVVSRRAAEAVLRGAPVYAPGVLAASGGVGRGDLVALAAARERPGT